MRALIEERHGAVRGFLGEADRIVAYSEWVRSLLLLNGVPQAKILLCPQGLTQPALVDLPAPARSGSGTSLRLVFLGRFHPTKGAGLLIRAVRGLPGLAVTLDLYGIEQGSADALHACHLKKLAEGDPRIRFRSPVSSDGILRLLRDYDLLAVPSQWLETGPLVVLEAFAAGVPVIASGWGGLAEKIQDGVNGLLVESGSVEAWASALRRLCEDRQLLARLREGVRPPRSMGEVAQEVRSLYEGLLK